MGNAKLVHESGEIETGRARRHRRRVRLGHRDAAQGDRPRHLRPGLRQHRVVPIGDHLHRRRRRDPALPRVPDRAAGREVDVPRGQLPADLRRAARRRPSSPSSPSGSAGTRCCTRTSSGSSTASRATRTRCRCCPARSARCRPSTRTPWTRSTPSRWSISTVRLLAKLPTIAAYAYKKSIGQPFLYPDNSLSYVENFLRMTFGVPGRAVRGRPGGRRRRWTCCSILHADHEQNCSTSTVRLVGSSHANLFASVSAGINALFGPLHGGANQAVLEMLEQHPGRRRRRPRPSSSGSRTSEHGVKLMGFGHRVYKNYDPRAAIVKKAADEVLDRARRQRPAARHRHGSSRRSRSPTTTSSRASSTRTSTSTPA